MRVIIANFDAELEMARAAGGEHPRLPSHVRRLLARRAGQLSRLDPAATIVASADEASALQPTALLAWAETPSVHALRERLGLLPDEPPDINTDNWLAALWSCAADPAIVRRCHDRRFWLALATGRGQRLPETHVVSSLSQLRTHLPAVAARSLEGAWVAKAPLGASGRERVYRWDLDFPEDIEIRLARLLERYGDLILEPLMKRVTDIGVAGFVGARGTSTFDPHRLVIDDAGVFRDIDVSPEPGWLADEHDAAIRASARAAGDALAAAGYIGAFGIDAFVYRDAEDQQALHPMCEINARLTFGHLARAPRRS